MNRYKGEDDGSVLFSLTEEGLKLATRLCQQIYVRGWGITGFFEEVAHSTSRILCMASVIIVT